MTDPIAIRPHHFLCIVGFQGAGYSLDFVKNFQHLKDQLESNPETLLRVEPTLDQICGPCPHNQGTHCIEEKKIQHLDSRHQKILGLQSGQTLTWAEGLTRLAERMTLEKFHEACAGCDWKDWGVCERALGRLRHSGLLPPAAKE